MAENAAERLARMLSLVPYISRRPGVAIADLAAEFDVTSEQITADLDLLMVCGLPGYYPDDLIDVVLDEDGGTVSIAFDAGIERPVRLTSDEAVALTVALRALADLPGLVDADAVHSALAKLAAAGAQAADAVAVAAAAPAPALADVRRALDARRQLWMRYYTASRDALSERVVDPMRLLVTDGFVYLEAFCHLADAVRHFRIDRIEEVRVLDEPAQEPLWLDPDVPDQIFHPDPAVPAVSLLLAPSARWIAEYYQTESVDQLEAHDVPDEARRARPTEAGDPGWQRVRLRTGGDDWVVRLVLSLAGAAIIEGRPDLTAAVAHQAAAALAAYL